MERLRPQDDIEGLRPQDDIEGLRPQDDIEGLRPQDDSPFVTLSVAKSLLGEQHGRRTHRKRTEKKA